MGFFHCQLHPAQNDTTVSLRMDIQVYNSSASERIVSLCLNPIGDSLPGVVVLHERVDT